MVEGCAGGNLIRLDNTRRTNATPGEVPEHIELVQKNENKKKEQDDGRGGPLEIAEHDRNAAGERGKVHRSVGVALSVAEARAGGGTTSACSKRFLVAGSGVLPVQNGCSGKMDLAQVLSRTGENV